jgi:AraC-like DNA-binding protein
MPVVGMAHDNPAMRAAMRRGLRRRGIRLVGCRTAEHLDRVFRVELVDAVVVGAGDGLMQPTLALAARFPRVPFFLAGALRPDDASLVLAYREGGVRDILVDGVDDHAAAELVWAKGASSTRRRALRDAPRLLRLTEPLQVRAWDEVLERVGSTTTTAQVAAALRVTREYLSREFAAGGAPNIKRVIDLARILCAADLLGNPGYSVGSVAGVLRFSSPSHLAGCARRIMGGSPGDLPRLGLQGVLGRFLRGRTRSRL